MAYDLSFAVRVQRHMGDKWRDADLEKVLLACRLMSGSTLSRDLPDWQEFLAAVCAGWGKLCEDPDINGKKSEQK